MLRAGAVLQFFADQDHAVEDVKRVGGVLSSIGQKNGCLRHDGGSNHALAPVVDFVIVEAAFAEPQKFDHIGSAEADGIGKLSLRFSLVESDFHECHVLVAIGGGGQTEAGNAFNDGFGLDFLTIGAAEDPVYGPGNLTVSGRSEEA